MPAIEPKPRPGGSVPAHSPALHPVTLADENVRLEPLEVAHADELWYGADDPDMWRYMLFDVRSIDDLRRWIGVRRLGLTPGTALPFLQRDVRTGRAFGATSLFDLDATNRMVEIGHTWLAPWARGTGRNVAAKRLLFGHAFDALGMMRVQLKCDARNLRSRGAILHLGATFEGVLRAHRILPDGGFRDTAMYSVVRAEWPRVRDRLTALLAARPHPEP